MRASSLAMSAVMLAIFTLMTAIAALTYPEGARFQPLIIGIPAIALCVLQLVLDLRARAATQTSTTETDASREKPLSPRRELRAWSWFLSLIGGVLLLGFWMTIPIFLVAFLRYEARCDWPRSAGLGIAAAAALYLLFGLVLRSSLHEGFLLAWFRG